MPRTARHWFWLCVLLSACAASPKPPPASPASSPAKPAPAPDATELAGVVAAPAPAKGPAAAAADRPEPARVRRMLDIEATLRVEVKDVPVAAEALRQLVHRYQGEITSEVLTSDVRAAPQADFTLRVAATAAYDFLAAIEHVGVTRSRQVQARDVGKQYYDATLRLRNLEVTRDRLEQILTQAQSVADILRIESELTRIRGDIEQIKGDLRYLEDRTALATVHVTLFAAEEQPTVVVNPAAQFYPGVRAAFWHDMRGNGSSRGYYGGTLSIGFTRRAGLSLGGYRRLSDTNGSVDAFTATLGGRFYSEFLGGDSRPWVSPYVGLAAGYARFEGRDEVLLGGAVGIDILKNDRLRWDIAVDTQALFGSKSGPHLGIVPSLGIDVAF
jgi:hypothetical protein